MIPRTRIDTFKSSGSQVRVFARKDCVIGSQQFVHQDVSCKALILTEEHPDYDYYTDNERWTWPLNIEPAYEEANGVYTETDVKTRFYDFPLNKSITSCQFYPTGSQNRVDTMCDVQRKILPYLSEKRAYDNVLLKDVDVKNMGFENGKAYNVAQTYQYEPRVQGGYFFEMVDMDDEKVTGLEPDLHPVYNSLRNQDHGLPNNSLNEAAVANYATFRFSLRSNDFRLNQDGAAERPYLTYPAGADAAAIRTHNITVGLGTLDMYPHKKQLDDNLYHDVYRTTFEDMVFRANTKIFNRLGTGEAVFELPYNFEFGPFDKEGFAELRAVDFMGHDISADVRDERGFYKMTVWKAGDELFGVPLLAGNATGFNDTFGPPDPGANPAQHIAGFSVKTPGLRNMSAINLYFPIRRFCKGRLDDIQYGTRVNRRYLDAYNEVPSNVKTHYDLEVSQLRENAPEYRDVGGNPLVDFVHGPVGTLTPHTVPDGINTRLHSLVAEPNSIIRARLLSIKNDITIPQTRCFSIRANRAVDFKPDILLKMKVGGTAGPNYWDGGNDNGANFVQAVDPLHRVLLLMFPKSAIEEVGGAVRLNYKCKYVRPYSWNDANNATLTTTIYNEEVRGVIAGSDVDARHDDLTGIEVGYRAGILVPVGNEVGRVSYTGLIEDYKSINYSYGDIPADHNAAHNANRLYVKESNSKILHSIADKFWTHTTATVALTALMTQCWTLEATVLSVHAGNNWHYFSAPDHNRCEFTSTLKEPLFSFGGTSQFKPVRIFPSDDYFSPMLQDYTLTLGQKTIRCKTREYPIVEMTPQSSYEIQIRNRQAFLQETKQLLKIDSDFPRMLRFESTGTRIEFETGEGAPDEIFMYLEKAQDGRVWSEYKPVIKTIEFKVLGQDIDSVTKLDETAIYYATARNSNFRTDTQWNRKFRGGILLTAEDFEYWNQWESVKGYDNFRGSIEITKDAVDNLDLDEYDESLQPSERFKEEISGVDSKFTVIFIYKDYSFSGEVNNYRFWKK